MATATTALSGDQLFFSDDDVVLTTARQRFTTHAVPSATEIGREEEDGDIFFTETLWYNFLLLIVNLLAIFLNGMIIFIVARYREMRNTVTLCFVNLAITDICLVLSQMSGPLRRITGIDLKAIFGCAIVYYLHQVTILATGLTMTFLAFDRYRIVVNPLKSIKHRNGVKIMLSFIAIWLLSCVVYIYIPFIHVNVGTHCTNVYTNIDQEVGSKLFSTSKVLINYVIPVVLSSFFYGRIYVTIKRTMIEGESSATTIGKGDKSLRSRRLRGIRTAALVLALYMVCYLPAMVLNMWRTWDPNFPREKFYVYHLATGLFAKISTVLSPFLYALSANSFKTKLRKMFCCFHLSIWDSDTANSKANNTAKEQLSESEHNNIPSFKGVE